MARPLRDPASNLVRPIVFLIPGRARAPPLAARGRPCVRVHAAQQHLQQLWVLVQRGLQHARLEAAQQPHARAAAHGALVGGHEGRQALVVALREALRDTIQQGWR